MLEQVRYITNPTIYSNVLIGIADYFNQAIVLEKRERFLLSHLGRMMCYYYLGERNAFLMTQQKVSKLEFDATFWENYGDGIKGGAMVAVGTLIGLLASGVGAAMGAKTAADLVGRHQQDLDFAKKQFEKIKSAIIALRWQ